MKKIIVIFMACAMLGITTANESFVAIHPATTSPAPQGMANGHFEVVWEKDYGDVWWWSARYEGPQPVGDADNDGNNELLIGGRDPFMRVMKYNGNTYVEQAKLIDPVFGLGYSVNFRIGDNWVEIPEPFGSATGFGIGDIDNDGKNEIGVAWGRHFSAFKWNGMRYKLMGRYIVADSSQGGTTLDCIIGDYDNDGENEVIITGGFSDESSLVALEWDGSEFVRAAGWGDRSIFFPWIADVDNDGLNEVIVGNGRELTVLKWNGNGFDSHIIEKFSHQVFGCVGKDSTGDGINEIHVTFGWPQLCIYRWNGSDYEKIFDKTWTWEADTIEAIDVGDVDGDGHEEVCVGTDKIHIFEWNGSGYEEEYFINDTYGLLAVTCVGDFDNDGNIEINAGSVGLTEEGQHYMSWILKYRE
ncbi:MAG TPA: VCBS repeat-containing protein [Thermoplasmatales archaeon]|nr:MAG: VCBS repeat-containing protein [Thermoplasmata archaeon]HDN50717.1 VCBS repeat-containing protein [Thermoplasmatales archaeon]